MLIENQVCSLSLSKQLKLAGYPQEGMWKWAKYSLEDAPEHWELELCSSGLMTVDCIAPTVAELGERLPINYCSLSSNDVGWSCGIADELKSGQFIPIQHDKFEANARAKAWLYLKKEGKL